MNKLNAIVLYDGYCRLCNGVMHFIVKRDKRKVFQFVPLQSEQGQGILKEINIIKEDTVVFVYENSVYTRSDAFVEMVRLLPSPWNWMRIIKYLPKKWRNYIYDVIAKNRFRWFGKRDTCSTGYN